MTEAVQTIYVLIERGGEYSDAWHNNLMASHDRAKLEAHVARVLDYRNRINAFAPTMYPQWEKFAAEHVIPERPTLKSFPKWKAGLRKEEITQEMRDERKAIEADNRNASETWGKIWSEREEAWTHTVNGFLTEAGFNLEIDHIPNAVYYFRETFFQGGTDRDLFYGREFEIEELELV
jgi:hypothetical protein